MGSSREGRLDPKAKRHVDDVYPSLDSVLAAAEVVESLLAHPGWDAVEVMIASEVETINRELDRGGEPHSRAEYAKAHGRRGGLLYVRQALDAIVQRADERYREQQRKHEGVAESAPEGALA